MPVWQTIRAGESNLFRRTRFNVNIDLEVEVERRTDYAGRERKGRSTKRNSELTDCQLRAQTILGRPVNNL